MTAVVLVRALLAAQETTTTAVPRIVGEPLPSWVVLAASAALLAAIVVGGVLANRYRRPDGDGR